MATHRIPIAGLPAEGQMKELDLGGTKVLLARVNDGELHAMQATCPHYGMPLVEGLLCGSTLRCAYHQSLFDITSGKLLDPPALEGLTTYPLRVENGVAMVMLPDQPPVGVPAERMGEDRTFVIVGAGAAGTSAAVALRELGFRGRITLVTAEAQQPYDRPNLSKEFLAGKIPADYLPLRPDEFYTQQQITLLHQRVTAIDPAARAVHFADGSSLVYDKMLLATGAEARRLDVPGSDLGNVMTLRSREDCERLIAAASRGGRVVVVGSSFIGMEVAASLREREMDVAVVTP